MKICNECKEQIENASREDLRNKRLYFCVNCNKFVETTDLIEEKSEIEIVMDENQEESNE
jgi:hypothetical protein